VNQPLTPKEITCECGNKFISQQRSNWCRACGKQLSYDLKDQKKSRTNQIYIASIVVIMIGLLAYFFIEIILTPLLNLRQL
jgi:predicted amidophosphoribosyltransferase